MEDQLAAYSAAVFEIAAAIGMTETLPEYHLADGEVAVVA